MPVLKHNSPVAVARFPKPEPLNIVPSASSKMAGSVILLCMLIKKVGTKKKDKIVRSYPLFIKNEIDYA
jgi:hypothetical protein